MAINLSAVPWTFVGLMTALAFITALVGSNIARNRFWGAIIAAILFAIGFVAWNYYPHTFGLPILKATGLDGPTSTTAVTAPSAPAAPPAPPPLPDSPPADNSH